MFSTLAIGLLVQAQLSLAPRVADLALEEWARQEQEALEEERALQEEEALPPEEEPPQEPPAPAILALPPIGPPVPPLPPPGSIDWMDRRNRSASSQVHLGDGDDGMADFTPGASKSGSGGRSRISGTAIRQQWNGQSLLFFELKMDPGTGFFEKFLLHVPWPPPVAPRPMLVVFHKFGSSHWDVWQNTTFIQEALARDWYLVCPLGASKKSFASLESQLNIETVLDWVTGIFSVDPDRIYGVGFSMGGGAVTSYAARHLDPARPMLAAIVDHSGGVDLSHTYYSDAPARYILDFWFGDGSAGSADPWRMARSSVIRFDPSTLQVQAGWDLARNLVQLPVRIVRAQTDPIGYLSVQSDVLDSHMKALGVPPGARYGYYVMPETGHWGGMLDEPATCDWFAQQSLSIPDAASLLADRNGTWYHLGIEQEVEGQFTPITYELDPATNSLKLSGTANLRQVALDTLAVGLDPAAPLQVELSTADALEDQVLLRGWPTWPSAVLRDGLPETNWTFDFVTGELRLLEYDGGPHVWQIQP